jgi:dienelactone hydrolase
MSSRVTFTSGGEACVGYLHGQLTATPRPCVVLCTGFGGTQDTPALTANARLFADAGYVAMTFDYRNFGESGGSPRQLVGIESQLADIHAAVDCARRTPGVDPDRVALWGTSLGGGHVVTAAARGAGVAAVVAQIPFNGFPRSVPGRSKSATLRLLWAMVVDAARGLLHLSPAYIPAVGGPGDLAVMASLEAQQAIAGMTTRTWKNSVAPRALFEMMRYHPGDWAPDLKVPLLVCVGAEDRETSLATAAALAHRAPQGVLNTYPYAHFDFYRDDVRRQVTRDQVEFLDRVLRC